MSTFIPPNLNEYTFDNSAVDEREKQEELRRRRRRVYSTVIVDELIKEKNQGYDIPYDAFFNRDIELKAPGVTFDMTQEEYDIMEACTDDPIFYVENFCKFLTDKGRVTVDLRDFQRKAINTITEEKYIPQIDDYGPKNRNIIWMAARQTGKCISFNELCDILENESDTGEIKIGEIYNKHKGIKNYLHSSLQKIYSSKSIGYRGKLLVGKLIELLERFELRSIDIDEKDISKKIIDEVPLHDIKVMTDTGYQPVTRIYKTQPYTVYRLELENGKSMECADLHIVYTIEGNDIRETWVKDLLPGDWVITKDGPSKVTNIIRYPFKHCMYDMTVDSPDHRYYSSGILSHNTTTIAAFLSWMIVFHPDKNILVVANKEKTAIEIVDKIIQIFRALPYFMKPGCVNFGKMSVKLENGSQILCSATTNTASIGFTIHCVLLDEFAHIPDNIVNNFWRSVYPTLSSSSVSQCIITSTPNGTTNKFYEIWSKSLEGKNSFVNMRTDYYEVPGHDQEWADQMRADFGEEEFAQEFELQFNVNSTMLAKTEDLQFAGRIATEYVYKPIDGDNVYLNDPGLSWHPDFDPNNIPETAKFLFLVDLAEGINDDKVKTFKNKKRDPDFNTIDILMLVPNSLANVRRYAKQSCDVTDCFKYVQVGKYTSNEQDEEYCANVCAALAYDLLKDDERDSVRVAVEMNFNGKNFTSTMQRHENYSEATIVRTFHTKPVPGEKQRRRLGFKTSSNKEQYCLKGAKILNKKRVIVTDRETLYQIQCFGYVKGKLTGIAYHDDLSMPIFNHIPRMLEEDTYVEWLEDNLASLPDENKRYALSQMIEMWEMENPEMSDAEFNARYGGGDSGLPFAGGVSMNPYSENNAFPSGFGASPQMNNPYSSPGNSLTYPGRYK